MFRLDSRHCVGGGTLHVCARLFVADARAATVTVTTGLRSS